MFTVALDRSLIEAHPAARMIKRFDEHAGRAGAHRSTSSASSGPGLDAHPGAASDAIRLRLLLGQRGEEIAGMQWAEVDLDARVWDDARRPDEERKTAPRAAPADGARAAHDATRGRPRRRAARLSRPDAAIATSIRRSRAIHGGAYQWTDLRRTVATRLAKLGFDETTIGRVFNHARVHRHGEALQPARVHSTRKRGRSTRGTASSIGSSAMSRRRAGPSCRFGGIDDPDRVRRGGGERRDRARAHEHRGRRGRR